MTNQDQNKTAFIERYTRICRDEVNHAEQSIRTAKDNIDHTISKIWADERELIYEKSYYSSLAKLLKLTESEENIPPRIVALKELMIGQRSGQRNSRGSVDILADFKRDLGFAVRDNRDRIRDLINERKSSLLSIEKLNKEIILFTQDDDEAIKNIKASIKKRASTQYDQIKKQKFIQGGIVNTFNNELALSFNTKIVKCRYRSYNRTLGRYRIIITKSKIYIANIFVLNTMDRGGSENFYAFRSNHPHVNSEARPCWGNVNGVVSSLLSRHDIPSLLLLSWNFLSNATSGMYVNPNNLITQWKQEYRNSHPSGTNEGFWRALRSAR